MSRSWSRRARRPRRALRAVSGVCCAALAAGLALAPEVGAAPEPAKATAGLDEIYPVPPSGTYTFAGRGFGHGHGMSQWGAYGAAKVDHLSANQILHFYYPHTTLATRSTARTIRVLLSAVDAPDRGYVQVSPAAGLAVTAVAAEPGAAPTVLPKKTVSHKPITSWRLTKVGASVQLQDRAGGVWHGYLAEAGGASFSDTAVEVPVVTPAGVVTYRGVIVGELESGSMQAVNVVNLESYLLSVVPAEMPSSWSGAALQAQAVAARTYARRGLLSPKSTWFDVYGDTRDQAYAGVAHEAKRTTNAIAATAGEIIVDRENHAVFAQYASADGGWTVSGGESYLPSEADPYDGAVPNDAHAWQTQVAASSLQAAYPSIGTLTEIDITGRDGDGVWGGRVTALNLVGTKATVALTGTELQFALGLRSPWFRPTPTPAPPAAARATATATAITASWMAPPAVPGAARVTGYRVTVFPGSHTAVVGPKVLTATVTRLSPGAHRVRIVALSAVGASEPAIVRITIGS